MSIPQLATATEHQVEKPSEHTGALRLRWHIALDEFDQVVAQGDLVAVNAGWLKLYAIGKQITAHECKCMP